MITSTIHAKKIVLSCFMIVILLASFISLGIAHSSSNVYDSQTAIEISSSSDLKQVGIVMSNESGNKQERNASLSIDQLRQFVQVVREEGVSAAHVLMMSAIHNHSGHKDVTGEQRRIMERANPEQGREYIHRITIDLHKMKNRW